MAEPHHCFSRIKNLLLVFLKEAWLYYHQARNSKTVTERFSVSSSIRAKAQTAGISFSYYLREISRPRSADFFFVKEGNLLLYRQEILNVSPIQEN